MKGKNEPRLQTCATDALNAALKLLERRNTVGDSSQVWGPVTVTVTYTPPTYLGSDPDVSVCWQDSSAVGNTSDSDRELAKNVLQFVGNVLTEVSRKAT